mgnify:CR=1 FL=1
MGVDSKFGYWDHQGLERKFQHKHVHWQHTHSFGFVTKEKKPLSGKKYVFKKPGVCEIFASKCCNCIKKFDSFTLELSKYINMDILLAVSRNRRKKKNMRYLQAL